MYSKPFPSVVTGTTISSTMFNGNTDDVAQDLNTPRPIVAGGTGASSANAALTNLSAEKANQVVANYDTATWMSGSFVSAAGAASAPTANAFAGVVYVTDANNIVVEARDATTGMLYVRRKVAGTWINSGAWLLDGSSAAVRYDAPQTLTAPQILQARQNIYAAPFDAMAYNGMQVNGSMEVSQEKGAAATTATGYFMDMWQLGKVGTSTVSVAQGSLAQFDGLPNYAVLTVSTAQASMGATDIVFLTTVLEGYRMRRSGWGTANAQPITIGFWCRHVRTGTYSITVQNAGGTYSYVATYQQLSTDVPEFKTVTIPPAPAGSWSTDNTLGMFIVFTLAGGTAVTTPANNSWQAGNYKAAIGQVNGVAATSDVFKITGVVILPGSQAPSAAQSPFIMRPYDQELLLCKRYYEINGHLAGQTTAAAKGAFSWQFASEKRASPTIGIFSAASKLTYQGATFGNISALNPLNTDARGTWIEMTSHVGSYTPYMPATLLSGALYADARL